MKDFIDRMKANPRFWSDDLYRSNVIEFIRATKFGGRLIIPPGWADGLDDASQHVLSLHEMEDTLNGY